MVRSGAVATITINRPERRNALNRATASALLAAVQSAASTPDVRAIVLTGAGPAFCAGDDITTRAIALFKELRQRCTGQPTEAAIRWQDTYHARAMTDTTDAHEGLHAYLQRRTPDFTGQ